MHVVKKGNRNKQSLAYTSLVRPIHEYEFACWDLCRGQINSSDRVQKNVSQFINYAKDSEWEPWLRVGR